VLRLIGLNTHFFTLQEQRTHIDVLDAALSNAQNTVLRLEEEVRQKEAYADRVKQMTKSLEQLQVPSQPSEQILTEVNIKLYLAVMCNRNQLFWILI
jgi:angiomotin like